MIVKELQISWGEIYLGGKKTIATDVCIIISNIGIYFQMDAAEFEGCLYTILSEETFKNQRIHTIEENDDYTISNYISQNFGMIIG